MAVKRASSSLCLKSVISALTLLSIGHSIKLVKNLASALSSGDLQRPGLINADHTRNSAVADKPRDTFRGQSRSPNMLSFDIIVTMALFCVVSEILNVEKYCELEIRVSGQSRLLNVVPFARLGMVSYWCSILPLSIIRTVFEIFDFKNAVTLKTRVRGPSSH